MRVQEQLSARAWTYTRTRVHVCVHSSIKDGHACPSWQSPTLHLASNLTRSKLGGKSCVCVCVCECACMRHVSPSHTHRGSSCFFFFDHLHVWADEYVFNVHLYVYSRCTISTVLGFRGSINVCVRVYSRCTTAYTGSAVLFLGTGS
jgi:hypothetical protein